MKKNKKNFSTWYQLVENKSGFKKILHSVNKYYAFSNPKKSACQDFREEVVLTENENLDIFIKRFGEYEFFIGVKIYTKKGSRFDSWIHVDGVSQERVIMTEKNEYHPVFDLPCITDLFEKNCKKIDFDLEMAV